MVTTVAPTIPVLAAMSMPTIITAKPSPPGNLLKSLDMLSSNVLAISVRSRVMPIKTNKGTATNVWLVTIPKTLLGINPRIVATKIPKIIPMNAKRRPTPAKVAATGYPATKTKKVTANINKERYSIISSHCFECNGWS